jgi:four helix bundle protein
MADRIGSMVTKSFKDLIVWQKAVDLAVVMYREFDTCKDYSFKDQIQRATISISNNIAEGYAKRGDRSFRNHLMIAKGSCAEVESMLIVSEGVGLLGHEEVRKLMAQVEEVGKLLSGFIRKLQARD